MSDMVALADTTGAAVFDVMSRLNFPTEHPLDCRMNKEIFKQAESSCRSIAAIGKARPISTTASTAR